jgi:ABC-2 type transport system permease protein
MVVIAVREYLAAVRTKAFIISVLFLPLMMGSSIGIQVYLKKMEDSKEKLYAVVDRTPGQRLVDPLQRANKERHGKDVFDVETGERKAPGFTLDPVQPKADVSAQRYELSEQVRDGKITGFLEIGADVLPPPTPSALPHSLSQMKTLAEVGKLLKKLVAEIKTPEDARQALYKLPDRLVVRYQSKAPNAAADPFFLWAQGAIDQIVRDQRCRVAKLPPELINAIATPVPLVPKGLTERNGQGEYEEATVASLVAPFLIPAALLTVMFLMIMVGATPLMQGVLEEKTQRIAEVLLGSVQPFTLMMGKLLGTVGVSMTMAAVYLTAGYWAADHYGYAKYVPFDVLVWFVAFQALAVLMYGSVFIAIGAACTEMRETQTLMWPVVLMACIPTFMLSSVIQDRNSSLVTAASFFPPATPMLMIARQSVPPGISAWQPAAGVLGVLLTTLLCVYAAGRIFRVGLLMQGKGAKFSEMVKWVFRG